MAIGIVIGVVIAIVVIGIVIIRWVRNKKYGDWNF